MGTLSEVSGSTDLVKDWNKIDSIRNLKLPLYERYEKKTLIMDTGMAIKES